VEVSDTGAGMDEETKQRCLEPFYSTKGKGGTGLGLAMVYGVMRRHEGTIEVRSQLGKGTTFVLQFPIKKTASTNGAKPALPSGPLTKKLRVLVVDDESMVREVLTEYLSGDGHSVETAPDGRLGLKLFTEKKFDLVITDRAMPEMGGDQMSAEIKKIAKDVPLIMLTGFGELMKAKDEIPAGVDYLLSKPLTFEAYREALAKAAGF
jgi:CheY-like chemotaxis protein